MGYRLRPRLAEVECPPEVSPFADGEEPFRATVRTNLTFDELDALPSGDGVTYRDIFAVIAPYVVAWNWTVADPDTGVEKPAPVPAEAGPDAFRVLTGDVVVWLLEQVQTGYQGGEE
jgi:hypothetical protein